MMRIISVSIVAIATISLAWSSSPVRAAEDPPGKQVYDRVCKVCHGPDGEGDAGPALVPFDREVEDVMTIVRDGTGQMPPVSAERVSDEEIAQIVAYLKTLKPK